MMKPIESRQGIVALAFAENIVAGDFNAAHGMLAPALGEKVSPAQLQAEYEGMIEYGGGPPDYVGVVGTLEEWPARQEGDVAWVYVTIDGEGYVEAVYVLIAEEQGRFVIREIEWGRP